MSEANKALKALRALDNLSNALSMDSRGVPSVLEFKETIRAALAAAPKREGE